ncbi:MAG: HEAT repeat domain-containing protein [Caldilineaceae bacterium]|nr:HEAT repeat domain-containing protein [Caldilineaceae bacterium]
MQDYEKGAVASRTDAFVVCMSIEANDRNLQATRAALDQQHSFAIEIWDAGGLSYVLLDKETLVRKYFGSQWAEVYFGTSPERSQLLDSEALLLGPVQARGLTEKVEEAGRLAQTSPEKAAKAYRVIADELREHFPAYADRFDLLQAKSLKDAGNPAASHDVLMKLAIGDLIERAEPKPSSEVTSAFNELHDDVHETQQAREAALRSFVQWHEHPQALEDLAYWFDALGPDDEYAPVIATLIAEAAVADREFRIVLDRVESLRRAGENGDRKTALRVSLALADAGVEGDRVHLIRQAEELRLPKQERAYVHLRAARWLAWEGEVKQAEQMYRKAMESAAKANLDLDVERALWSLTVLYPLERYEERAETYRSALTIQGSRSYVMTNPRTREHAYRHLANRQLANAHLWSRYRLLESIRSGSLADELEARGLLARLYSESDEPLVALEQGLLGGDQIRVKDLSSQLDAWPDFLADMVGSPVFWVRMTALTALEQLGDLAPVHIARRLARECIEQLRENADNWQLAPATFQALKAVVLEATEEDLECLMPVLERVAPREINMSRLTDPGVGMVAARLYRFRPAFRSGAASVLAEMAAGRLVHHWVQALNECGNNLDELIAAFERVAEREGSELADPLSDLGHLNAATRALWSRWLQAVEQYPLGEHSEHNLASWYEVPRQFLEEQEDEVVNRYVRKLVAIGSNCREPSRNRSNALNLASNAVELLSNDKKKELFEIVKPLTDSKTKVSAWDEYQASTLHPLSRFRISLGDVADLRAAALLVLARSAMEPEDCSYVEVLALRWLGTEPEILQRTGAEVLTLPHLSSPNVRSADLADHPNPGVRRAAVELSSAQKRPDLEILEHLASDSNKMVRIQVVYMLERIRANAPEAYARIGSRMRDDRSAMVRAFAAEVLAATS